MAISLSTISSGYNVSAINDNFTTLLDFVNNSAVWKTGTTSGETSMTRDLDMNGYKILNYPADVTDSSSLITVGAADTRYYNVAGDKLEGPMDVSSQRIYNLPTPTADSQAVPKSYVDPIKNSYSALTDLVGQLLAGSYSILGEYTSGPLTITDRSQLITYQGYFYALNSSVSVPYTTTGNNATTWLTDSPNFSSVGNSALRTEIYSVITPVTGLAGGQDNGLTDSLIMQEALASGNKVVIFPPGDFYVQIPLHVYGNTHVIIPPGCTLYNDIRLSYAPEYFTLDVKGNAEPVFINAEHGNTTYSYGYTGDSNIIFSGGGKIDGYWRQQRSEYCSSIKISHAENILIENIIFDNQWKSHFIELNSTRHARVTGCRFGYIEKASATGNWECINVDYSTSENYPHSGGWDNTPCHDISIDNNTSHANEALVGSHTYLTDYPHTNITVASNKGYPGVKSSDSTSYNNGGVVKALNWKKVDIYDNVWTVATISFDFIRTQLCEDIDIHSNRMTATDLSTKGNNTGIYCLSNNRTSVYNNTIIGPISYGFLARSCTYIRSLNNTSHYAYQRAFYYETCTDLDAAGNMQGWGFSLLANGYLTEFNQCDKMRVKSLSQVILETATIATAATCTLLTRNCTNVYELNYASIDDFPYSSASVKADSFKEIKVIKTGYSKAMIPSSDTDIQCMGNAEVLYYTATNTAVTTVTLSRSLLNYHSVTIFIGQNTVGPTSTTLNLVQSYGDTINNDNVFYVPFSPAIDSSTGKLTYSGAKVTMSTDGLTLTLSAAAYVRAVVANKDGYTSYTS